MAKSAGVALDDWIADAIAEYAQDLGADVSDLDERERLEAIEERIDRLARVAPAQRGGEIGARGPVAEADAAPRRRQEASEDNPRAPARRPGRRDPDSRADQTDLLEETVERIERRARRLNERSGAQREPFGDVPEHDRMERALAETEQRAERALRSLSDLVEARGGERDRLEKTIEEVERRAARSERRATRALESLAGLAEARKSERERLESAIERIGRRAEQSETRTARALESVMTSTQARLPAEPRKSADPPKDAVAARLDALARRAAGAPAPSADDEEAFRLVAERLARRRKQRQDVDPAREGPAPSPAGIEARAADSAIFADMQRQLRTLAEKVDALADAGQAAEAAGEFNPRESAAAPKDPAIERMERELAALAEPSEQTPGQPPAVNAAARAEGDRDEDLLQGLERRLDEFGRRIEASARPQQPDPRPLEELARRVEAIRVAVERQGARPEGPALLGALADLNAKLDRASQSGSQSAAPVAALQAMILRLEETLQRKTPAPIDPRPIEELARRIEGMRSLVARQDGLAPKVDQIHAALGELRQKLDRPASTAVETQRLEAALRQLSADVHALAHAGAPDMRPVEELAGRIEAMRRQVEGHGALLPKVDQIQAALGELGRKIDQPATSTGEIERFETALRQLSADVHALARTGAPDVRPVEDLARRIEAMRKAVESQGQLSPQVDRLERSLAEIAARLDHPVESPRIDAVDASLRQLAARFAEAASRPATVALDTKPIEDLARRIESVRESLEKPPALAPQVDRLETALGAVAEKLDRAQPVVDAQGINATLAEMSARLAEAFRRPAQIEIDTQPIEALAAQFQAVRETVERQAEQLDAVGRPIDELGRRLDTLRGAVEQQAKPLDFARLKDAVREAVESLGRPAVGPEELRTIVAAIQALASKIDGGASAANAAREDVLEHIAERLDRPTVVPADIAVLAAAIVELTAKIERPSPDISRLEAIAAQAESRPDHAGDLAAVADAISELSARLDRDAAGPRAQALLPELTARFDQFEARLAASRPGDMSVAHLESALGDLADKLGDFTASADTRAVEQELRLLHEKMDDLADERMSSVVVEQTAQAVVRALGERPASGNLETLLAPLQEIQERIDEVVSLRPSPAALEQTMIELTEELEAFRSAREAVGRGAATLSEMRAEQLHLDRRMDARFTGVQEVLEKLVDRLNGGVAPGARAIETPARGAMLDIPDRSADETRPAAAPGFDAGSPGPQARLRDGADGVKAAAINTHIAAARRAANAAAAETERRETLDRARNGADKASGGWPQRASAMFNQHRRPVLLAAAGAMTLLTGVAVLEMRGHAPLRKSEAETPNATPLAQAAPPKAGDADLAPTGAIGAPPRVIAAPLPLVKATPKPATALIAALPAGVGTELAAAGARGDVGAEVEIAQRYLEGRTVPRDPKAAAAWLQTAADAGNVFAQYRLGALYEKGIGAAHDLARARELYQKAAAAGNARAMHNLAVLYAQDGGAGKPDYAGAIDWFRKAASYGVRDSQFNLGVLYGRGLGGPQDLAQSWMWFSAAARQGDADAARKRDEVANRMDGRAMAAAQKLLDAFKPKTPDPAANDPPPVPAAAASAPAEGRATGVKG